MKDSEGRLCLSALEERLLQRDGRFTALRQTQESTAAALPDRGTIYTRTGCACLGPEGNANSAHSEAGRRPNSQSHSCAPFNFILNFLEIFTEFRSERFCGVAAATLTRIL
jgi:hypothetical protein